MATNPTTDPAAIARGLKPRAQAALVEIVASGAHRTDPLVFPNGVKPGIWPLAAAGCVEVRTHDAHPRGNDYARECERALRAVE